MTPQQLVKFDIRYYKGLGTSDAADGREYFEKMDYHRLDFKYHDSRDDEKIIMAFSKDKCDERKKWITDYKVAEESSTNEVMDFSTCRAKGGVHYSDFVDKELIQFSIADCERSIPSVVDGFKPGQRKIIFSCFKRNLVRGIKVAQLAGYVSEQSAYHHGEASLTATIVGIAQDFVGSNNISLLKPDGQFGLRLAGGKDHAAARYIFTQLTDITRAIFCKEDDFTLSYRDDDGMSVEPFFYMPVIPMVLVNGTSGIGTGFSTNIPSYAPLDVIHNIRRVIRGDDVVTMKPWYFGFKGVVEEKIGFEGKFISKGCYTLQDKGDYTVINITELPIGLWTNDYKKFLDDMIEKEQVVTYRECNSDVAVDFDVVLHPAVLSLWNEQGVLEDKLGLKEYIHATNIIAFNQQGQLTKYPNAEAVLKEFYLIRLDFYGKRKDYLLAELSERAAKLHNMVRFITEVVDGALIITRRPKKELLSELVRRGYRPFPPVTKKKLSSTTVQTEEDPTNQHQGGQDEDEAIFGAPDTSHDTAEVTTAMRNFNYLLSMKMWCLTAEMIHSLEQQLSRLKNEIEVLQKQTPKDLWLKDLEGLENKVQKLFHERDVANKAIKKKHKSPMDRIRIPILSDKAREALEGERSKTSKKNTIGGGRVKNNNTSTAIDATDAVVEGTRNGISDTRKKQIPNNKKKRKQDSSSGEGEPDWSSINSDEDDGNDVEGGNQPRRNNNKNPSKATLDDTKHQEPKKVRRDPNQTKKRSIKKKVASDDDEDNGDKAPLSLMLLSAPPQTKRRREKEEDHIKENQPSPFQKEEDIDWDAFGLGPTNNHLQGKKSMPVQQKRVDEDELPNDHQSSKQVSTVKKAKDEKTKKQKETEEVAPVPQKKKTLKTTISPTTTTKKKMPTVSQRRKGKVSSSDEDSTTSSSSSEDDDSDGDWDS